MTKKILHLHLEDSMGNKETLICRLKNGSLKYSLYGGHGSSGTPFSLRNIQYYEVTNGGNIRWLRDESLPVEALPNETLEEFKKRVINKLNNSTSKVIREVSTNVSFA